MKELAILFLILYLLLALVPGYSQAQEAISESYTTTVEFPTSITFNISAESNDNITQVILDYKTNMITNVTVTTEVEPEFKALWSNPM